jgi:glycosyltransferase involved in cell wall biosynthesis
MSQLHFERKPALSEDAAAIFRGASNRRVSVAKKPRLLMVGMHLTRTRGGISTLTADILSSPLKDNFDIRYIASQAEDLRRPSKLLFGVYALLKFLLFCIVRPSAIVYVHIGSNASLYREAAFILLGSILGRKTISHFHAGDIEIYFARQPELGKKVIRKCIGLSDTVIAVSRASASQLEQLTHHPHISVLKNAIDTSAFTVIERSIKERGNHTTRLLFVGAAGKLKGEQDFIRALASLRDKGLNIKADLIGFGAGRLAGYCEQLGVSDLVGHLGPVPMDKRVGFYRSADIFVLPTYAEAMPISVIEAMAAGLAIVTTPVGGIPELIDDGEDGMLVPVANVEVLAEQIAHIIGNPKLRLALGRNARRKAVEQLDFAKYIDTLQNELRRLGKADATK